MTAPGWASSGPQKLDPAAALSVTSAPAAIGSAILKRPTDDGPSVWAAVREVSAQLVDLLGDGVDRVRARQLIDAQVQTWAHEQMTAGQVTSVAEQRQVSQLVFDRRFGLGALQPFLERSDVENIVVNGCQQTWITYTDGTKELGPPVAETDDDLIEWVQLLARRGNTGREFSHASPLLDVALSDGVRLAVVGWVSRRPHLAIRVHRLVEVTLGQLTRLGTLIEPVEAFLRAAIAARRNVIVCGEVNTGKTTLVRALANQIPPEQRLITLESDFELFLDDPRLAHRHPDVVALEARQANAEGAGQVRLQDLVPACLRLNPDRVIVGEARHGELAPMLEVMYSGARGSMCTLHVHRPEHVFSRVVQLGRRADLGLGANDVHLMFGLAEPLIVYLERDQASNDRYVSHVLEIGPPADSAEPTRNHIFTPGPGGRAAPAGGHISTHLLDELTAHGFDTALLASGPDGRGWT
ncbi:CpaF family protein [Actinomadura soli]|uniref:CpaF family protein n=1 Tax=Actinomadura soli TaxID=2508997 RepID=A0A5C4J7W3_9ACTN|nr:CpaF family protein [Actinomadura soli]